MKRSAFPINLEGSPLAWAFFGTFFLALFLLSYGSLSLEARLWTGLLGLLIPFLLSRGFPSQSPGSPAQAESFPQPPVPVLALLGAAAVFLRFFHLTTLSVWPLEDEAMNGYYAIALAERGEWHLTYDFSGMPPLYVWGLGLFFKLFGISLGTLWFFPALLSSLALWFLYAGSRKCFSRSFSLVFTGLMAFSFWPLYAGRFSVQGGFLLFWECLTLYAYGSFRTAGTAKSKSWAGFLLGAVSGLGFYTFTSWAIVAFCLTLVLFFETVHSRGKQWRTFLFFFLPEAALFLALATATFSERGGHFRYVLQNPFGAGWPGFNDLQSLFWGSPLTPNLFAYRPWGGGFLNPLLGALVLWGAVSLGRRGLAFWKQAAFFLLLILPGFLTGGLDGHRILQALPFLLFAAAYGLLTLLSPLPPRRRLLAAGLILALGGSWDAYRLFGIYHSHWLHPDENVETYKPVERGRAFQLLKDLERQRGPGFVLADLVPDIFDQSLPVAAYAFDATQNFRIPASGCGWAALLVNVHYQSYFERVFPEGRGFWLAGDMGKPDGGFMLEVIPYPSSHTEVLNRWIGFNRAMRDLAGPSFDNHDWKSRDPIIAGVKRLLPLTAGDPFLISCLWEKVAENEYQDRNYPAQVLALREALTRGVPAAHLYNNLGALFLRGGHPKEAREALERAIQCRPNHTSAATLLRWLEETEKTGRKPVE